MRHIILTHLILALSVLVFYQSCDSTMNSAHDSVDEILKPTALKTARCEKSDQYYQSKINLWYTLWWDLRQPQFWRYHSRVRPARGFYGVNSSSQAIINQHLEFFVSIGVDTLILDHTNGVGALNGLIDDHAHYLFRLTNSQSKFSSLSIALAVGGPSVFSEYNQNQSQAKLLESGHVYNHFTDYLNYAGREGKPLLISYSGFDDKWLQWSDDRFYMEWAIDKLSRGLDSAYLSPEQSQKGFWGWYINEIPPLAKTITINPGYNKLHTLERQAGQHFIGQWLRAIKANPENIVLASWNDFAEETHIEAAIPLDRQEFLDNVQKGIDVNFYDSSLANYEILKASEDRSADLIDFRDSYGNPSPYWYEDLMLAYSRLKYGLVDGFYYREELDSRVFEYSRGQLVHQMAMPVNHPVVVVPQGYFRWFFEKNKRSIASGYEPCNTPPGADNLRPLSSAVRLNNYHPDIKDAPSNPPTSEIKGLFMVGTGIYFSNGGAFCQFPNMELYRLRTGRNQADGLPQYSHLPDQQQNHGYCQ